MFADRNSIAIGSYQQAPRTAAVRPVWLAPRPVQLAGRDELLAEIRDRLTAPGMLPRVIALYGLGGVGKTSLALEYAHRYEREYGLVWQVAAEDPATLSAHFGELAALLGVRDLVDAADPVRQVHAALAARTDPWLLVLDNVIDAAAVADVLPPAGSGHVLITTRSAHWPIAQALEVPVLDLAEAAGFLLDRTGTADTASATRIAEELGALPLALEQAAAYMHATGRSLGEYLAFVCGRRAELLAHGQVSGYDKRVATTWTLALEELGRTAPVAIALLRLLACYAPEAIPIDLLLSPHGAPPAFDDSEVAAALLPLLSSPLAVDAAVTALRRYSLISPPSHGAVSMHRLVQAVTLDQLTDDRTHAWRRAAALLLNAALPHDPARRDDWPTYSRLLPLARAALTPDSASMRTIVKYLDASGDYTTAMTLQQQIHDSTLDRLGPDHPDTLTARNNLAYYTGRAGNPAAARDQFAVLLPIRERVSGPDHPETLVVRSNLARWTGDAGDAAAARDQYAVLLPIRERVSGPDHPATLVVRSNLAYYTGHAGDAAAARDQFAVLLPIRERVSGPGHPETLVVRSNLARWTGDAGDAAAARDQYAVLLPIRERVSGPDHPETLTVRSNLAYYTGRAGNSAAARDQFAVLLPIRERVSGPDHPETLTVRSNLAYYTGHAGDAAAARDQCAALLPVSDRVLGPDHPETLIVRSNLARWTGDAGDAAAARDQCAALLPVSERVSGPGHPETLIVRSNLARWTGDAGDAAAARDQCAALLPVSERVLGPDHPETLIVRNNLAYYTGRAGNPAAARDQFAVLLPIRERVSGPDHPETRIVRNNLARWTEAARRSVS